MRWTLGQFEVKTNDLDHNFHEMLNLIQEAKEKHYDLIVFPEYSLTGYALADQFYSKTLHEKLKHYHQLLIDAADRIDLIFGSVFAKDGYIYSGAVIVEREQVSYSLKRDLNKREINEKRYFKSGSNSYYQDQYLVTFSSDYQNEKDAIVLASDPYAHTQAVNSNIILYANSLGINAIKDFVFVQGGQSFIKGLGFKHPFEKGLLLQPQEIQKASHYEVIVEGIRAFDQASFHPDMPWIVGNSGGIDSALTIALLHDALGAERVRTYNLSSQYNSDKTINNAAQLAQRLKIQHKEVSIDHLVSDTICSVEQANYQMPDTTLVEENIQARLRGHLLSTFAALEGGVICNNGNKVELALGYCTLYGDTIGALSPLGDLLKVECFELAKEINQRHGQEIIPENLIPHVEEAGDLEWDLAPTAELKEAQVDPMKWYYHDNLIELFLKSGKDAIIKAYDKNKLADFEAGQWLDYYQLNDRESFMEDLNWLTANIKNNRFKRIQTPPVLCVSDLVIGVDYQE